MSLDKSGEGAERWFSWKEVGCEDYELIEGPNRVERWVSGKKVNDVQDGVAEEVEEITENPSSDV